MSRHKGRTLGDMSVGVTFLKNTSKSCFCHIATNTFEHNYKIDVLK